MATKPPEFHYLLNGNVLLEKLRAWPYKVLTVETFEPLAFQKTIQDLLRFPPIIKLLLFNRPAHWYSIPMMLELSMLPKEDFLLVYLPDPSGYSRGE